MKLQNISLRTQVILIVAIVGTLVTSFVAYTVAIQQREVYYSQFASDLDVVSQRIAFDLELDSNNLGRELIALAALPAVNGIIRATQNNGVDRLLNIREVTTDDWKNVLESNLISIGIARPKYAKLRLIGMADNGREIVRVDREGDELVRVPETELQQEGDASYFRDIQRFEKGSLYYSAVNLNRENGVIEVPHRPTLRVGTPIYSPADEFFGAIFINWDIQSSFNEFENALRTQTGIADIELYVTNREGEFLHHPNPAHTFGFEFGESYRFQDEFSDYRTVLGEETTIGQLSQNSATSLFTANIGDKRVYVQPRLISINPLDESDDLFLVATLDRSVLDAPVLTNMFRFWISAILIGAVILLLLIWLLSYQLSPLLKITESAESMAEGDYQSRLPSPRSKEIGGLVAALDHLQSKISQRENELRTHHRTLEATVSERTREFERARDEANRQAKFKSEFLANMSHEIRTPMTAILGLVDVIRHTEMSSKQQQYVHQIYNSSRALLHIINDILDISKIEAGKVNIELAEFSLLDTLEDAAILFASSADLKSIELHLSMDTRIDTSLIGDRTRLSQVFNNLVGNAVKFTETGEVILKSEVLEMNSETARIRFSVSDTGMGITEEAMARLFKAFEQADTATTRMFGGTGLGLAISYKLVELMGGELQAKSVVGEGSEFWFDLEFKIGDKPELKLRNIGSFGKKVLLINSHPVANEILGEMLVSWGCKVNLANNAELALESVDSAIAAKQPYDFMLMDCEIAGMDSFELIDRITEKGVNAGFPINSPILLMTESDLSKIQREKSIPENVKIGIKPLTVSRLLNLLEEMGQISIFKEEAGVGKIEKLEKQLKDALEALSVPVRVLLAEDNKTNQMVIQELLSKYRIQFIVANNGKEAVEAVHHQEIDLVLMDLQMPIMDGFEATQRIRKHKSEDELPILSLSAATFTEDLHNASLAGMNAHLSKPINIEKMLVALLRWLPLKMNVPQQLEEPDLSGIPEKGKSASIYEPGKELIARLSENTEFDLSKTLLSYLGPTSFLRMVKSFCEEFDEIVEKYKSDGKWEMDEKRRTAHSLKSAAANIGAISLAKLATQTEIEIKDGNDANFNNMMEQIAETLEIFK